MDKEILIKADKNILEEDTDSEKKDITKWINSITDKFIVKSIKNNIKLKFKFLDNTSIEGTIKWFNKYTLTIVTSDGSEYILLKHSLKYIKT